MDWAQVEAAGLLDGADDLGDRRALVEYLAGEGVTIDEMVAAQARGGLLRVSGERYIRPGAGTRTLSEVADRTGAELQIIQRIYRTLGVPVPEPDDPSCSDDDIELAEAAMTVLRLFGERAGWALLRRYGALLERATEATSSAVIGSLPDISTLHSGSEVVTAKQWDAAARVVPQVGRLLDLTLRLHVESVRRYFEQAGAGQASASSFLLGVGFADLSGYTAASLQVDPSELAARVMEFEGLAADVITARGGRVVKFVGDAVLFVSNDPDALVDMAREIIAPPESEQPTLLARAGLSRGWCLARDGDYFGPAVNLASRLVEITPPGRVVVSPELHEALDMDRWSFDPQNPVALRGIDEPITTFLLRDR